MCTYIVDYSHVLGVLLPIVCIHMYIYIANYEHVLVYICNYENELCQ